MHTCVVNSMMMYDLICDMSFESISPRLPEALAVAGLSVLGRDRYGVFPLRGKLRNVRDLTVKQMLENKEIDQAGVQIDATKLSKK